MKETGPTTRRPSRPEPFQSERTLKGRAAAAYRLPMRTALWGIFVAVALPATGWAAPPETGTSGAPSTQPAPAPSAPRPAPASSASSPGANDAAATASTDAEPPRRDPQGIRGISPFWERLRQGDRAFLVRDYATALEHYRAAAILDPRSSEGHLRMAEAQIVQGQLADGRESLLAARRFAVSGSGAEARALFLLADLAEREGHLDEAAKTWRAYLDLAAPVSEGNGGTPAPSAAAPTGGKRSGIGGAPRVAVPLHVATAKQRLERIEARKKALEEYAPVRERMAKGLEEAEQASPSEPSR